LNLFKKPHDQAIKVMKRNFNVLKRNLPPRYTVLAPLAAIAFRPHSTLFTRQARLVHSSKRLFQDNVADSISIAESRGRKVKGVRSVGLADVDGTPATARKTWAYCTAEGYNFERLKPALEQKYAVAGYLVDDVFHIRLATPSQEVPDSLEHLEHLEHLKHMEQETTPEEPFSNEPEAFIFENGTFVVWGATQDEIQQLRTLLSSYEENSVRPVETEWFDFVVDPETYVLARKC